MAKTLNVLLTGANGYLGEHIKLLMNKLDVNLYVLNRNDIENLINQKFFIDCEIPNKFELSLLNIKFDLLIHSAAISSEDCFKYKNKIDLINVKLTDYLSKFCQFKKIYFLFLSSVQVYGSNLTGIYDESSMINPHSLYSFSKSKAEKKVINRFQKYSLKGSILRVGNIVGRPLNKKSSGWKLYANSTILESVNKRTIYIKSNANIRRNFVSIKLFLEFINYLIFTLKRDIKELPNIINITSKKSLSLYEFAFKVKEINRIYFKKNVNIKLKNKSSDMIPYSYVANNVLSSILTNSLNYELDSVIYEMIKYEYDNNND